MFAENGAAGLSCGAGIAFRINLGRTRTVYITFAAAGASLNTLSKEDTTKIILSCIHKNSK